MVIENDALVVARVTGAGVTPARTPAPALEKTLVIGTTVVVAEMITVLG